MNGNSQIIDALKAAMGTGLRKDWTQPSSAVQGINYYNLEAPAKTLYPVHTPLRNRTARVKAVGGTQANWRAITAINSGNTRAGVSQGNRGGSIQTTVANYTAAFAGIGLEDYATFEADYAANGFQDVKALAVEGLLRSTMIAEEALILGGNASLLLGTATAPTVTAGSAGALAASTTHSVIVTGLTLEAYLAYTVAGGITASVTRTNRDGSSDTFGGGVGRKSAASAAATTTGTTGSLACTVPVIKGAVAYAWYWGATAGTELLGAITTINSVLITAAASGTQNATDLPASDQSKNGLVFDGLMTHCYGSNYGGYVQTLATGTAGTGTTLTSDNAGGIVEIDKALQYFWDALRLSPTDIYVSSQEMANIGKKILAGNSSAAQRFVFQYTDQGVVAGGVMVRSYLNKFSMAGAQEIPVHLHPNLPPGTILFYTGTLPYPLSNVSNVTQMLLRKDYEQIEWPRVSRKYEYGIYFDGVLQNYFPPSFGLITNIANG